MNPTNIPASRRSLLKSMSAGFGYLAFAGLSSRASGNDIVPATPSTNPLSAREPHFVPRAKRIIFLCMQGGPSHVDTFDYKPELIKRTGQNGKNRGKLLAPQWDFRQHGESGLWISDLFPNVAKHADDLCLIRSMHCDQPVHPRAMTQMHTGNAQFIRPSMGAWTLYGLGTENESMPGFVALNPPNGGSQTIGSAFLPAVYQGTPIGGTGGRGPAAALRAANNAQPQVPDIKNSRLSRTDQRRQIDFIQTLNQGKLKSDQQHAGVEGAIESLELAFRMQETLPDLMDLNGESEATLDLYGINQTETSTFGRQCLLARRFVESGVRFVEISHGNWDHHVRLGAQLTEKCNEIDKPIAGLLTDLAQRGMLKDTLVMWGGEFGRTPDGSNGDGRDHNNKGYTTWMAGGGVKGGFSYGATDEFGYESVENKCHIHDWHATILHLLGLNHEKLTYRYAGRDFRLTDVYGNVMHDILA